MKKFLLMSSLLAMIGCSNANTNLPNGISKTFSTENNGIIFKGNEDSNAFNLEIINNSNKLVFVNWSAAKISADDENYTGLYDLSNVNNSVYNEQENLLRPKESIVGKFAPKANLLVTQNESVNEFIKPYVWGSKNLKNNGSVEIEVPISIGGYNGEPSSIKLDIKK